jgi:hypothetical protein
MTTAQVEQELRTHSRHLHTHDTLPVILEGARRPMPRGNPVGNLGAAGRYLHPHHPLRRTEAPIVFLLCRWE